MQFILTTDGNVSFATFIYEGIQFSDYVFQIGFDAGDQERYTIINHKDNRNPLPLSKLIFRIDGKKSEYHYSLGLCGFIDYTLCCD